MMTYREYMDWQFKRMRPWRRFLTYMAGGLGDWRKYYLEYVLKCILKSKDLEEARERATIALGGN